MTRLTIKLLIKLLKSQKNSPKNSSETVANETEHIAVDREIPKERYISPEKRQEIINDLKLI